jgi:glycosyltransferase involved in cell wall biosynthesis
MNPKISVIIPAYNEERLLKRCLQALKKQSYPKDAFEVIVVDNGSQDRTAAIAKDAGVRVYTYRKIQGCAASRQFGFSRAKGSILAFTDADSMPEKDWLKKINTLLADPKLVCVGGRAIPDENKLQFKLIYLTYYTFDLFQNFIGKPLLGGYNIAVKKAAYEKAGGFKPGLFSADDWELSISLYKAFGARAVKYVFDLNVYVSVRKLRSLKVLYKYNTDMTLNYINLVLLQRRKVRSVFNVR